MSEGAERDVNIFNLTWVEVKEWLEETDIILVPMGSCEQHGPHLPLGIDTFAGEYVAQKAAEKARVPVAPSVNYGYSPFHMRRHEPGTLTISSQGFFHFLYDIGKSCIWHGFNKIVYVTGHTANSPVVDRVVRALKYETGALAINYAADTEVFADLCADLLERPDELPGWHGGEIESSAGLLIKPDLVRMERAKKGLPQHVEWMPEKFEKDSGSGFEIKYEGYPVRMALEQDQYSELGIMGNPNLGSREKGEKIYGRMIDLFARFLEDLKTVHVHVKDREFAGRY
jgi:creatinine amidohydrolase